MDIGHIQHAAIEITGFNVVRDDRAVLCHCQTKRAVLPGGRISKTARVPAPDIHRLIEIFVVSNVNLVFGDSHIAAELTAHNQIRRILNCALHIALVRSFLNQRSLVGDRTGKRGLRFAKLDGVIFSGQDIVNSLNTFCRRLDAEFLKFDSNGVAQLHRFQTGVVLILFRLCEHHERDIQGYFGDADLIIRNILLCGCQKLRLRRFLNRGLIAIRVCCRLGEILRREIQRHNLHKIIGAGCADDAIVRRQCYKPAVL